MPGDPHFYGRIDSQPEGIDQIFGKEHPERRSSSFDQQERSPRFSSSVTIRAAVISAAGITVATCRRGPGSEQEVKTIFS